MNAHGKRKKKRVLGVQKAPSQNLDFKDVGFLASDENKNIPPPPSRKKGKCCAGVFCAYPQHQLIAEHKSV